MKMMIRRALCAAGLLLASLSAYAQFSQGPTPVQEAFGPPYRTNPNAVPEHYRSRNPAAAGDTVGRVVYWNQAAVDASKRDHAQVTPTSNLLLLQQGGPTHASRAFAIVQLAVYDAVNAIFGRYPSYSGLPRAPSDTSPDAAVAQAAHDAIVALWPAQQGYFDKLLDADLARLPSGRAKYNGIDLGRRAAAAVLALRQNDNADNTDLVVGVSYFPSNEPGKWRPDPISMNPNALGALYGQVRPFTVPSVTDFRVPPPPALSSSAYAASFNQVKSLGADGRSYPTTRTAEQTWIGVYWSYDSTPWLGPPVSMYNKMAVDITRSRITDPLEMARLLALVDVAIADTVIATWSDKYFYNFWRPVTAIREAEPGIGPSGLGDGNPYTHAVPNWTPLGAQASNLYGPDFTPPFPSYPSGHAGMTGALFQILRRVLGTDNVSFTFVSDEWNGVTHDNMGWVRPWKPRSFSSFSQAEAEAGLSRVYLGVHWNFDLASQAQGEQIANYVYNHGLLRPAMSTDCGCRQ
ncbi:vanadium-dependent haloperoxidase [Ramlibacter sp.]